MSDQPQGCLTAILKMLGINLPEPQQQTQQLEELPYRLSKSILSNAERSFFGVLQIAVNQSAFIFPKVRLADFLYVAKGTQKRQSHFNKISSKHVDFLLCDTATIRPILAIELDDSSHNRESTKRRDEFVEASYAAAGLPVLRVPAARAYDANAIATAIRNAVAQR